MDASIIILTKNGGEGFRRLLERIYRQRYDGTFEVIVIDSGSTDGTSEAAGGYPVRFQSIPSHEFHHSRTRNLAAGMAQGKYIVFITQDALPAGDDWMQKLVDSFADPQVAMVVGRQIAWDNVKPPERFFYHYNFPDFRIVVKSGAEDHYHDNVFISNVNAAYRSDVLMKYGFKEDMVMAEDKEIAARLIRDGYIIVYEPSAAVYHAHDYGLKDVFVRYLDYGLALEQGAGRLPGTDRPLTSRIGAYLGAELAFLKCGNCLGWAPYAIIYEMCKYAGLLLGRMRAALRNPQRRKRRR